MRLKSGDCGVCCFAMVTGMTYEESLDFFQSEVFTKPKDYEKELWVGIKEMEKGLNLVQTKYIKKVYKYTLPEGELNFGKKLPGDYTLFCCQAVGMFLHWIVYLPNKYVIDPDPRQPDKVYDFDNYNFKRVTSKYFCVLRKEK